ncbi:MAG: sulfatase-like hydrolase/transferase [Bacteroidota bacterium]
MRKISKKRKRVLGMIFILFIVFAYLLWPLHSDEFQITWDQQKIKEKSKILSNIKLIQDSLNVPPNIVIILADDLGKSEVSAYGQDLVHTPNIDAIGTNGALFTEAYITSPICSPSRAGLITGRYQQRFGYELQPHDRYPRNWLEFIAFKYFIDTDNWVVADEHIAYPNPEDILRQGLPPSEITLAELLKASGYRTGVIGKWHLGLNEFSYPLQRGFDYHYGFYEAFSLYAHEDDSTIVNHHHDWLFTDKYIWGPGRTGNCAIYRNNEVVEEREYITKKFAQEAIEFIDRNKQEPFLLYLPFNAPHTPFQALKEDYEMFDQVKDQNKRVYYAMIKSLDDAVGKIMDELRKENLLENTLVFFLSDNGGASYTKATDNFPLKGGKITNFEGGINIPFMMQWKESIPSGQVFDKPVSSLDIFATAIQVAGVEMPRRKLDGVDLIPYVSEQESGDPHEALYWRSGYNLAIRKGDWKLIINEMDGVHRLYNLKEDKSEERNLYVRNKVLVEELEKELNDWSATLVPPRWPRIMDWEYNDGEEVIHFAM